MRDMWQDKYSGLEASLWNEGGSVFGDEGGLRDEAPMRKLMRGQAAG